MDNDALLDPLRMYTLPHLSAASRFSIVLTSKWGYRLARPTLPQWKYGCSQVWLAKHAAKAMEIELAFSYDLNAEQRWYVATKVAAAIGRDHALATEMDDTRRNIVGAVTIDNLRSRMGLPLSDRRLWDCYLKGRSSKSRRTTPTGARDVLRYGTVAQLPSSDYLLLEFYWKAHACDFIYRRSVPDAMYEHYIRRKHIVGWPFPTDVWRNNPGRTLERWWIDSSSTIGFARQASALLYIYHTSPPHRARCVELLAEVRRRWDSPGRCRGLLLAWFPDEPAIGLYNFRPIVRHQIDIHFPHVNCGRIRKRGRPRNAGKE